MTSHRLLLVRLVLACLAAAGASSVGAAQADVAKEMFIFSHDGRPAYLLLRVLTDSTFHAEYGSGTGPDNSVTLYSSPMVFRMDTDYPGPNSYRRVDNTLSTPALVAEIATDNGCIDVSRQNNRQYVTTICPWNLHVAAGRGISLKKDTVQNVYGIAQYFNKARIGQSDGDWISYGYFTTENNYGNGFAGFPADNSGAWGANSQVQFPIMYAVGSAGTFGFFYDNVYKQDWSFSKAWIEVRNNNFSGVANEDLSDNTARFYFFLGDSPIEVRRSYMDLVGRPPVPPRKAFGLWLSEFGYDSWGEIDWRLNGTKEGRPGLRAAGFPIDGFVLDLQWYGGVSRNSPDTRMGSLEWDPRRFPDPDAKLAQYRADHIAFIAIEQSYVGRNQWAYGQLQRRGRDDWNQSQRAGYLVHWCGSDEPVGFSDWFGQVGMIDWSEPGAGTWMHTWKRKPNLIDKGITGHWTDLGEPERFYSNACYDNAESARFRHTDIHNIYNFLWHRSIYDGYVRDAIRRRPFLLARAGAPGIHRFGAAMWSGDITSRLEALANHWNAQMQMSFNGVDYYGSDTGGFWRDSLWGDRAVEPFSSANIDDLYTQWYAASAWTDVPLRPHTYNCGFDPRFLSYPNCPVEGAQAYETSPAWIGSDPHVESHRFATRQRYELIPYYYSLAHQAYDAGTPVVAPPVMHFPADPSVRHMAHQKMIGDMVMVALVAKHGQYLRDVYLPRGRWVDYHTNARFDSNGQWIRDINVWETGKFVLPVFVRSGAILPIMPVDAATKDAFGHRSDGTMPTDLVLKVFADSQASDFTLWEDDGETVAFYDTASRRPVYDRRHTQITQATGADGSGVKVRIAPAVGSYDGAVTIRNNEVRLITDRRRAMRVVVNGAEVPMRPSLQAFEADDRGFINLAGNEVRIKTGPMPVGTEKAIEADLASGG